MGQTQTKKNSGDDARTDEEASSQPSAAALTPEKQTLTEEEKDFHQLCRNKDADISQLRSLLEKGVRLNIHDKDGLHPLWNISYDGRSDLIDLFLQHGAEVDLPTANKFGSTALIISCQNGHLETAKLLLQRGASINYQRKDGSTALYFACKNNHVAVVQLLLKSGAQVNKGSRMPLYTAILNGRLNIVQILLDHGADVNQPYHDKNRSSPLGVACGHNHPQVAQLLINNNTDVNYQDNYGNTPLHWGSLNGYPEVVKILVQSQANLNVKNKVGDTPLHRAAESGHVEVVRQLLLSQAKLDIKNNGGKTPLQVAEEKNYSEIAALLKTGVPAPGEGEREGGSERSSETEGDQGSVSVSVDKEEEELSVEELPSEDETDHPSQPDMPPPLTEAPKEGYKCKAQNSLCLVYLPQEINKKLSIETVTDTSVHPKIASNEIFITPVVRITSDNIVNLLLKKPAVIELAKTIELSDKEANNKVIPLCANSESSEWKDLGSECNCKVLKDRISFQVTHFSLYAIISRKHYPSGTVRVNPISADIPAPEHSSTPIELIVPELPGFKVLIPPSSVNADRETDITATVLYDCPAIFSEDDHERSRLALSCIELEPHGITFAEKVSISIPIPNYAEVIKNDPNAKLQVWHTNKCSDSLNKLNWNLVEHSISRDREDRYVATVLTEQFSWYMSVWDAYNWAKSLFITSTPTPHFEIKERCQVFMSPEIRLRPSQDITFSISVLFYPYKEEPEPVPCNYKYMLLDSGLLDLEVVNNDSLVFQVKFSRHLLPKKKEPIIGSFVVTGHQVRHQKAWNIELDSKVELQPGLPIGELTFGIKERPEETHQTLSLIKPIEQTPTATRSTQDFEDSIMPMEQTPTATMSTQEFEDSIVDAAKKLKADVIQYEHSPIVETAKSIANMWLEMAHLIRKESRLEGKFKEEIVDLAKSINKESQEVVRIAISTAEACTDKTMKHAVGGVVERVQMISHQLRILAAGVASRQRASDLEACQLLIDNATNLTSTISQVLYRTQSASLRVAKETRKKLGLTQMAQTDPITGKHDKLQVRGDRSREGDHCQDSHEGSWGHIPSSSTKKRAETKSTDEHVAIEPASAGPTETIKTEIEETDASQSISAQPPELDVWKLPGVEECGEASVVIYSSQGQLVDWNGLKLKIHVGSLPEGIDQCTIYIKASLTGEYEIPENSSLVSAVFWLRCEPQCTFTKPITVEIQHCSTKQDLSRLKIIRAFCNQKQLPYKFKPLGGRFNADTSYGAVEVNSFSGVGVVDESSVSERKYYSQIFYRSYLSHQQRHEINIIFAWNTEAHNIINQASREYPEEDFLPGCHKVIELVGDVIEVALDVAKWTKVMDGQWEIQPAQPLVTKAELDDFKPGRRLPYCVLEARPLCEDFPQLLYQITLNGIKPPHHKIVLSYMPSRTNKDYSSDASVQQLQASPGVLSLVHIHPQPLTLNFSTDMNYEQLAVWLTNHPQFMGADYQEDIRRLKGARINGFALLSLDESTLRQFGVSFGFWVTLMNIIENLKSSQPSPVSERLPSQQQQFPASSAAPPTTQNQPISSAADTTDKQTKFDELPTLDELLILKYMDKGKKKKIRIISEASHKWKNIANLICDGASKTTVLEKKCRGDPEECVEQALIDNFINKKPKNYSQDWNGLIELLDDVGLQTLAENVKQALQYACT